MKHDFHFVLNNKLKDKIVKYASLKDKSLSDTVVYIFNFIKPVLEKHHLIDLRCNAGEYKILKADAKMHVFFNKNDYKYLKQLHSNLYTYSMALVLRWALNLFFEGIDKYGFNGFCEVVSRFGSFLRKKYKNNNKIFLKKMNKRHLYSFIKGFKYICHIFDDEYNLINTKFT